MAVTNFTDAEIIIGNFDTSGDHNSIKLTTNADMLENTVFGASNHTYQQGLRTLEMQGSGFLNFDDSTTPKTIDFNLNSTLTAGALPVSIGSASPDGSTAYVAQLVTEDFMRDISVDQLGKYDLGMKCANRYARGVIMLPLVSRTGSVAAGTIYNLGAVSATQRLLANLHVTAFVGTSLAVTIQRNDTNNTTTPNTAITFTTATGVTSEAKELVGPITDTFYYVTATFVGTSFSAIVTAGIAPR